MFRSSRLFQTALLASVLGFALAWAAPAVASTIEIRDVMAQREEAFAGDADEVDVYMSITNHGDVTDRLYAVRTRAAEEVVLSATGEKEEREIKSRTGSIVHAVTFEIGAGETLVLRKDGPHVQMEDVEEAALEGKPFKITLFFEKAGRVTVDLKIDGD